MFLGRPLHRQQRPSREDGFDLENVGNCSLPTRESLLGGWQNSSLSPRSLLQIRLIVALTYRSKPKLDASAEGFADVI